MTISYRSKKYTKRKSIHLLTEFSHDICNKLNVNSNGENKTENVVMISQTDTHVRPE